MSWNSDILVYMDDSGTDGAECGRRVTGAIRPLVNARDFQFACASLA